MLRFVIEMDNVYANEADVMLGWFNNGAYQPVMVARCWC